MSEPLIGACAKHGRNLASCPECSPWRDAATVVKTSALSNAGLDKLIAQIYWEAQNSNEVERLRSLGQLRVACCYCFGTGREWFVHTKCLECNGTGWEWNK